jgi:hypothetical protein
MGDQDAAVAVDGDDDRVRRDRAERLGEDAVGGRLRIVAGHGVVRDLDEAPALVGAPDAPAPQRLRQRHEVGDEALDLAQHGRRPRRPRAQEDPALAADDNGARRGDRGAEGGRDELRREHRVDEREVERHEEDPPDEPGPDGARVARRVRRRRRNGHCAGSLPRRAAHLSGERDAFRSSRGGGSPAGAPPPAVPTAPPGRSP